MANLDALARALKGFVAFAQVDVFFPPWLPFGEDLLAKW